MSIQKILYIEDEDDIRTVVSMILSNQGIVVKAYACSQEAIDSSLEFSPDLLLLDISMPHKDGFETLAELRQRPGYQNVPAVFMTAQSDPCPEKLDTFQPVAVIMKPFDPSNLKRELDSIFESMPLEDRGNA
ncbi:MAG: response regulator [Mariniblastus sp.]|nr:response regulator [Mariniblastus sp.]